MADSHSLKHTSKEIFDLSKRLEDILHDRFEIITDRAKKGNISPQEIDAMVDETRNQIVLPVAQYIKRSSHH